ncbi:MAG: BadF/BadG/BcrA/BcrD ATPase family protein [Azospirillaceae bacterium]|nr:BadF/BadG/BcrA/BcrD ATPase family protein [Azospirillaceae bacterium]
MPAWAWPAVTNDDDRLRTRAAGPRFAGLTLETDAHTACLGAFSGRDGAILITGTGSAGYALVQGRPHIVGGWGFEVSDEGSGASIGRDAVRAALRGHDGLVAETALTRHVRAALGPTPAAIVAWADRAKPADYGKLAPEVLAFAAQGDLVAIAIIGQAVANLESYMHRLVALGAPRLCLMGGLAQPLTPWLSPWAQSLLVEPEGDALEGSLLLARFGAGTTPSPRDNPNISR